MPAAPAVVSDICNPRAKGGVSFQWDGRRLLRGYWELSFRGGGTFLTLNRRAVSHTLSPALIHVTLEVERETRN